MFRSIEVSGGKRWKRRGGETNVIRQGEVMDAGVGCGM